MLIVYFVVACRLEGEDVLGCPAKMFNVLVSLKYRQTKLSSHLEKMLSLLSDEMVCPFSKFEISSKRTQFIFLSLKLEKNILLSAEMFNLI